MTEALRHRGPDDGGVWTTPDATLALGSRRLAVIDRSSEGRQPMHSACSRYTATFNGEIYNHARLRRELESAGRFVHGRTDTAVLLESVSMWGVHSAVQRFNGAFAFAVWDAVEHTLHLARDRFGEKPLYYGEIGGCFAFASELKGIRAHPGFAGTIDKSALALYLRYGYIPSPLSIWQGVTKLLPGHMLSVAQGSTLNAPVPYWTVAAAVEAGLANPFTDTASDAVEELEALLKDAVRLQTLADVPVGALLSGGVDSSTVVALMQSQSTHPVRTFTVAVPGDGFNEAREAGAVAAHLGTSHTQVDLPINSVPELALRVGEVYDEPFADSSQLLALFVAGVARRSVTVGLSGDGGDELFGGHNRYVYGSRIWDIAGRLPSPARRLVGRSADAVSRWPGTERLTHLGPLLPGPLRVQNPRLKMHRLGRLLQLERPEHVYPSLVAKWPNPLALLGDVREPTTLMTDRASWPTLLGMRETMMFLDCAVTLPDDLLTKFDRAAMRVGLEMRVPLLDYRIAEFAWRLPMAMKIHGNQGKWILRQVLYRYVPQRLVDRPKMGFSVPVGDWLRSVLREVAEDAFSERSLRSRALLDPIIVRQAWTEHLSGRSDLGKRLWSILVLQLWLEAQS